MGSGIETRILIFKSLPYGLVCYDVVNLEGMFFIVFFLLTRRRFFANVFLGISADISNYIDRRGILKVHKHTSFLRNKENWLETVADVGFRRDDNTHFPLRVKFQNRLG